MKIEGDNVSAIEVYQALENLKTNINNRVADRYYSLEMLAEMDKNFADDDELDRNLVDSTAKSFHETACKYLVKWGKPLETIKIFFWALLEEMPQWKTIQETMSTLSKKNLFDEHADRDSFYEQYGYLKVFATVQKIEEWTRAKLTPAVRWVEVFKYFESKVHIMFAWD